jgi:hypothetical protein
MLLSDHMSKEIHINSGKLIIWGFGYSFPYTGVIEPRDVITFDDVLKGRWKVRIGHFKDRRTVARLQAQLANSQDIVAKIKTEIELRRSEDPSDLDSVDVLKVLLQNAESHVDRCSNWLTDYKGVESFIRIDHESVTQPSSLSTFCGESNLLRFDGDYVGFFDAEAHQPDEPLNCITPPPWGTVFNCGSKICGHAFDVLSQSNSRGQVESIAMMLCYLEGSNVAWK